MAVDDWIPFDDWDGDADEVRCSRCGERDLWWAETRDGWRLFTGEGVKHVCGPATASEFDMEDIDE